MSANRDSITACCPFHNDASASFIVYANGGYVCQGGSCPSPRGTVEDVFRQLGLTAPERGEQRRSDADDVILLSKTTYDYTRGAGDAIAWVQRIEECVNGKIKKRFLQWSYNGQGVRECRKHYPFPLYNEAALASLATGSVVFVVEGEKCVEAIKERGSVATTTSGGAKNFDASDLNGLKYLAGKRVIILPDNDDAGEAYAEQWRRECRKRRIDAVVVRIPSLPAKGDICDAFAAGVTLDEVVALADAQRQLTAEEMKLATTLSELAESLRSGAGDASEAKRQALSLIAASATVEAVEGTVSLRDAGLSLAAKMQSGEWFIRYGSGVTSVDEEFGGFAPGSLVVVGAEPGAGKTAWCWQMVMHIAEHHGPTKVYSVEMTAEQLFERLAVRRLRCPLKNVSQADDVRRLAEDYATTPVEIYDRPFALEWLEADVAYWASVGQKPAALLVDYLQIMQRGNHTKETEFVTEATRRLKQLAKRHGIVVFLISCINRSGRDEHPSFACFRGSSSIEFDADVVVALWLDSSLALDHLFAYWLKNRYGKTGRIPLYFDKPFMTFSAPLHAVCDDPGEWVNLSAR